MISKKAASALAVALWAALAVASSWTPAFGGEPLTNADIVRSIASGTPSLLVIANINTSSTNFDMSDSALTDLRRDGIPEDVIAAMSAAHIRASSAPIMLSQPGPGRVPAIRDASAPLQPLAPITPGTPASPLSSPIPSPMPPPEPAAGSGRFDTELANIAHGGSETRKTALAWMLANRDQALPLLRRALADSRPETQAAALRALGSLRDLEARVQIRPLLANQSPLVRESAALVLAEMEDIEAIAASEKVLGQQLEPRDGYIRLVGAARLVRASGKLAGILSESPSAQNRAAAAWALAEIGRAGSVAWPALGNALLNDADASVRREAARAVAIYHDADSARLLKSACRRDPEVRKIILQALADYPETVGFLVEVMKLGTSQIAPDELEAARNSLRRLTGEDYGMDGNRWAEWYASNSSSFPAAGLAASDGPAARAGISEASRDRIGAAVAERSSEIDITALGIVVDPSLIPMAPEVDTRSPLRFGAGGVPAPSGTALPIPPAGLGSGVATGPGTAPAEPMALSPTDFTEAPGAYVPAPVPVPPPAEAGGGGGSLFRTWSSDDQRVSPAAPAAGAGPETDEFGRDGLPGYATAPVEQPLSPGETRLWSPNMTGDDAPDDTDGFGSLAEVEPPAPAPVAAPLPAARSSAPPVLTGISLPLPGMSAPSGSSDDDDAETTASANPFGSPMDDSFEMPAFSDGFGFATGGEESEGDLNTQSLRPPGGLSIPTETADTAETGGDPFADEGFGRIAEGGDADGFTGDEGAGEFAEDALGPDDSFFEQHTAESGPADSETSSLVQNMLLPPPPGSEGAAGTLPIPFPSSDDEAGTTAAPVAESLPSSAGIDYYSEITDVHVPIPADSPLFVAPAPGQVVIGENILGDGEGWEGYPDSSHWPLAVEPEPALSDAVLPPPTADSVPAPPDSVPELPEDSSGDSLPPSSDATGESVDSASQQEDEVPALERQDEPEADDFEGDVEAAEEPRIVLPPVTDTDDGLVSELWDGPEEFYQSLDDFEGMEYEIVGSGEIQESATYVGGNVDFGDIPDMPSLDLEQIDAVPAPPASGSSAATQDGPPLLQIPSLD